MNEGKYKVLIDRAQEIAKENINQQVHKLNDERLEALASAIITTNALITAQLIAEYDDNKTKGHI